MSPNRRDILLAGLGLFVSGCAGSATSYSGRPRPSWPTDVSKPTYARGGSIYYNPNKPSPAPATPAPAAATATTMAATLGAIPRSRWTRSGPNTSNVNRMGGVNRITVHHEGWTPFYSADWSTTAARIEQIRNQHTRDRGWGDIGYHFIIDRQGRLWECRSLSYQGAHVKENNEHNVGIMCLGNFDKQSPSRLQLDKCADTIKALMGNYRVLVNRVYTHQELNPTACPGRNLQPMVVQMRTSGYLTRA